MANGTGRAKVRNEKRFLVKEFELFKLRLLEILFNKHALMFFGTHYPIIN